MNLCTLKATVFYILCFVFCGHGVIAHMSIEFPLENNRFPILCVLSQPLSRGSKKGDYFELLFGA